MLSNDFPKDLKLAFSCLNFFWNFFKQNKRIEKKALDFSTSEFDIVIKFIFQHFSQVGLSSRSLQSIQQKVFVGQFCEWVYEIRATCQFQQFNYQKDNEIGKMTQRILVHDQSGCEN